MQTIISLNGSKAAGKSTLATSLAAAGYGTVAEFYIGRYRFQKKYLPIFDPDVELTQWKRHTALLCYALEWHQHQKHIEGSLIFDHYYADYLVQQLSSLKEIDYLLEFIETYDLPPFSDRDHFYDAFRDHFYDALHQYHFFIDVDYETYLVRTQKRRKEHPDFQRDIRLIKEKTYQKRRELYMKLVSMGYLIHIDANGDKATVLRAVQQILKGENDVG